MIISHKHKFIFIKCGKVAGTSVEMALRPHLGPEDLITPVDSKDEKYAANNSISGPQNYRTSDEYDRRVKTASSRGVFYEHAWAYEIKGLVSCEVWNSYFKFAIERDPRDKSLSTYFHNRNGIQWPVYRNALNLGQKLLPPSVALPYSHPSIAKSVSLARWLNEDFIHAFCDNWCRYTANDQVLVDKIYNYSDLEILVDEVSDIVGAKLELPKLKSEFRERRLLSRHEQRLLDRLLENAVYKKEFKLIN